MIKNFKFTSTDLNWLSEEFDFDPKYIEDLKTFDLSDINLFGLNNGEIFHKDQAVLTLSGPLYKIKLLEFPISNIFGFSCLVCTNALRMRLLAGNSMGMLEFGLRRAQGPLAGLTASKYAYLGGFDGKI
jgi:nicotinate phosphoribosyltransferase